MVEWNVITGVVPPIGQAAWDETFEKYRQTPEFLKVNSEMSLAEYKTIFYNEYIHRMLGRFVGLLFVVPLPPASPSPPRSSARPPGARSTRSTCRW